MTTEPKRVWSPILGMGTLAQDGFQGRDLTFASEGGSLVRLRIDTMHVGTPAAWKLAGGFKRVEPRAVCSPTAEWCQWETYIGACGNVLVVRRGGPPPEGTPKPEDTVLAPKAPRAQRARKAAPADCGPESSGGAYLPPHEDK